MPDKFENATLGAKTEQKFSVHTHFLRPQYSVLSAAQLLNLNLSMLTVRKHSKIFSPFFSDNNFVNKVVSPRTRSARSRPEAFLLVRLRASRHFPSILWHQWLSKSLSWFSGVQYSCELKQYFTPIKRLKKKLLSTRQNTSCFPPCWIYDREGLGKINHMKKWRKRIQKVPDTKSSPSTLVQKSCAFKFFHSRERILKVPFSRIFLCGYVRCSVDGRPNRNNKVAFSNLSGIVWTRP